MMAEGHRDSALPRVGPPDAPLFKQGLCKDCGVPLFGKEPVRRYVCGLCASIEAAARGEGDAADA